MRATRNQTERKPPPTRFPLGAPPTVLDRIIQRPQDLQMSRGFNTTSYEREELRVPSVATSLPPKPPHGSPLPPLAPTPATTPPPQQPWVRKSKFINNDAPASQMDIINFADGGVFSDDFMHVEELRINKRFSTPKSVRVVRSFSDDDEDSVDGGSGGGRPPSKHARSQSSASGFLNKLLNNSETMTPIAVSQAEESKQRGVVTASSSPVINSLKKEERGGQPQPPRAGVSMVLLKGFRLNNVLATNPLVVFFQQCPLSLLEDAMFYRRASVLQPQQFYQWCVHLLWLDNPNSAATSLQRNNEAAAKDNQQKTASSSPAYSRTKNRAPAPEVSTSTTSSPPGRLRPLHTAGSYFVGRAGCTQVQFESNTTDCSSSDDDANHGREDALPARGISGTRGRSLVNANTATLHRKKRGAPPPTKRTTKVSGQDRDRELVQRLQTPIIRPPKQLDQSTGSATNLLPNESFPSFDNSTTSPRPDHGGAAAAPVEESDSDEEENKSDSGNKSKGDGGQAIWRAQMQMSGSTGGGALTATEITSLKQKANQNRTLKLRNYVKKVTQSTMSFGEEEAGRGEGCSKKKGALSTNQHSNNNGSNSSAASSILTNEDPVGKVMKGTCESVPFSRSEALELFQALDTHDDGVLDFRELCEGIVCMRSMDGAVIPFLHRFSTLVCPNIPKKDVRLVRISRQEVQYMATAVITVLLRRHRELLVLREKYIIAHSLYTVAPLNFTSEIVESTVAAAMMMPVSEIPVDPLAIKRYLLVQYQSAHGHGKARLHSRFRHSDFIFPQHEELYSRLEGSRREAVLWRRCGIVNDGDDDGNGGWGGEGGHSMKTVPQTKEAVAEERETAEKLGRVNAIRAGMAAEAERRRVHDARSMFTSNPNLADSIYSLTLARTGVEVVRDGKVREYSAHSTSTTSRTLKAIPAFANRCAVLLTEVDRFTMLIKLFEQFIRAFSVECDEQLLAVVGQDPVSYQLMQTIAQDRSKCPSVNQAFGSHFPEEERLVLPSPLKLGRIELKREAPLSPTGPSIIGSADSITPSVPLVPPAGCKPLREYTRISLPCEEELRRSYLADFYVSNDAEEGEAVFKVMAKPHQMVDRDDRVNQQQQGRGESAHVRATLSQSISALASTTTNAGGGGGTAAFKGFGATLFSTDSPRIVESGPSSPGRGGGVSGGVGVTSVKISSTTYTVGANCAASPLSDQSTDDEDHLSNSRKSTALAGTGGLSRKRKLNNEKHLAISRKKITLPDMSRVDSPEFAAPEYVTMGGKLVELNATATTM